MSQHKKLDVSNRLINFRKREDITQKALGEKLGVSGNYIYLMESGRKTPGESLLKLFETMETSPLYQSESFRGGSRSSDASPGGVYERLRTETLKQNIADEASHLPGTDAKSAVTIVDSIRQMAAVLADRLRSKPEASSRSSSETQSAAKRASSSARTDPSE